MRIICGGWAGAMKGSSIQMKWPKGSIWHVNWPQVPQAAEPLCHSHYAYQIRGGSGSHRSGRGSQIGSLADKRLLLSGQCNSSAGRHQRLSSVESGQFATSSHRIWIAGNRSNLLQICEIKRGRRLIKCCYFYYFIAPGLGEPFVSVPKVSVPIDQTSGLLSLSFHFHFWVA